MSEFYHWHETGHFSREYSKFPEITSGYYESDFSHHTFLKQEPVCNPGCVICQKIFSRLDSTPIVLRNELTGDLKTVPTYASREYLSKWSLWHEVPSSEAKKILSPEKTSNAVSSVLMTSFLPKHVMMNNNSTNIFNATNLSHGTKTSC